MTDVTRAVENLTMTLKPENPAKGTVWLDAEDRTLKIWTGTRSIDLWVGNFYDGDELQALLDELVVERKR